MPELSSEHERLKHIADTVAKLTNTCPQDERLSTNLASNFFQEMADSRFQTRSGNHIALPEMLDVGNNMLVSCYGARLEEAPRSEPEPQSCQDINSLPQPRQGEHWIMSKFTFLAGITSLIKKKYVVVAYHSRTALVYLGIVTLVGAVLTLLMYDLLPICTETHSN